jgi:hypothetical protein
MFHPSCSGGDDATNSIGRALALRRPDDRAVGAAARRFFRTLDTRLAGRRHDRGGAGHAGGWGATITIAQQAKQLSVEYVFLSRYDLQPPLTFTYPLDGSEGRNVVMMGRGQQVESSRARWNGPTLIITTTYQVADRGAAKPFTAELTRELSLESPTTMVVQVTRAGVLGGPPTTTRSIYRKG